jgi:hypothetical protein
VWKCGHWERFSSSRDWQNRHLKMCFNY